MADSPLDVGRAVQSSMNAASTAMAAGLKAALRAVNANARKEMTKQSRLVPGGDARFSNMARYNHAGKLAVKTTTRPDSVFVMSKGPWKLAEEGANPHRIGRGMHPGTRSSQGRRSWTKGEQSVFQQSETDIPETITDAVVSAFMKG